MCIEFTLDKLKDFPQEEVKNDIPSEELSRANALNAYYYMQHLPTELQRIDENMEQTMLEPETLPADCYNSTSCIDTRKFLP